MLALKLALKLVLKLELLNVHYISCKNIIIHMFSFFCFNAKHRTSQ